MKSLSKLSPRSALSAILAAGFLLSGCGADATPTTDEATQTDDASVAVDRLEFEGPSPVNVGFEKASSVVIPNSPGTLTTSGSQRVMTAILGTESNRFLGGPDLPVFIRFSEVNGNAEGTSEGTWLTTNAAALGLYVSHFEFPKSGLWEVAVVSEDQEVGRALVQIATESDVPTVGDPAPPTDSPTGTTAAEIAAISTDQDPNPAFYELSVADAIANGRPTLVAFVTPAFCQTALCGPTLETVKGATAGRIDLDVVHVEPFDLGLAPQGVLQPIPSMDEWGIVTEPWIFIIDGDGMISASFEGIIGEYELTDALDDL